MDVVQPCPFCGFCGEKAFIRSRSDDTTYWVECRWCYARGPAVSIKMPGQTLAGKALEAWNKRDDQHQGRK